MVAVRPLASGVPTPSGRLVPLGYILPLNLNRFGKLVVDLFIARRKQEDWAE